MTGKFDAVRDAIDKVCDGKEGRFTTRQIVDALPYDIPLTRLSTILTGLSKSSEVTRTARGKYHYTPAKKTTRLELERAISGVQAAKEMRNRDIESRRQEAETLTSAIREDLTRLWENIARAWEIRVWEPMGYDSWHEYVTGEFGTARWKIRKAERAPVLAMLRAAGMSTRAIASATGESQSTVQRTTAAVESDGSTEMVTGTGGKPYPAKRPAVVKPPRKSNREKFDEAVTRARAKHDQAESGPGVIDVGERILHDIDVWADRVNRDVGDLDDAEQERLRTLCALIGSINDGIFKVISSGGSDG